MKKQKEKITTFSLPDISSLSLKQSMVLLVIAIVCFTIITVCRFPFFVKACIFTFPMSIGLYVINKDTWNKLIRLPKGRDFAYAIGFLIPSIILQVGMSAFLGNLGVIEKPETNAIYGKLAEDFVPTIIAIFIQLFGEELIALIVFLFVMKLVEHFTANTKAGIIAGFVGSAIFFGAIHYPTYKSLAYVLLSISASRMLDNFVFLRTKNLVASYMTHVIFDFTVFALSFAFVL